MPRRRRNIVHDARIARGDAAARITALAIVVIYNLVGLLDVGSTIAAIEAGGQEANPVIRSLMESEMVAWAPAKIALQLLVSGMVLWFPHRFVVGIFSVAVLVNAGFVANNIRLALLLQA